MIWKGMTEMKQITIKKLYLENFKVFESCTLDLSLSLNVFGGPNGYGKTSIFDAIEWLITGKIKRICDNSSILGTQAFSDVWIARNPEVDVVVKGEFYRKDLPDNTFTIAKVIRPGKSGRDINPRNLSSFSETYELDNFDEFEYPLEKLIQPEELINRQTEWFGSRSQQLFTLLYYVQQEDRLDFLKNNEKERLKYINILFEMEDEANKRDEIIKSTKTLRNYVANIKEEIKLLSSQTWERFDTHGDLLEFAQLLEKKQVWDIPSPPVNTWEEVSGYIVELENLKIFINNIEYYKIARSNEAAKRLLNLGAEQAQKKLFGYLFYTATAGKLDDMEKRLTQYRFIITQRDLGASESYHQLNYAEIAHILNIKDETAIAIQESLREATLAMKDSEATLTCLLELRKTLHGNKSTTSLAGDASCIYCGYNWELTSRYEDQFAATTEKLQQLETSASKRHRNLTVKLEEIYMRLYLPSINQYLHDEQGDYLFSVYREYHTNERRNDARGIHRLIESLTPNLTFTLDEKHHQEAASRLYQQISEAVKPLPEEYHTLASEKNFNRVAQIYFDSLDPISLVTIEQIDHKINYLRQRYNLQISKKSQRLDHLNLQLNLIENTAIPKLKLYEKRLQEALAQYQSQLIAKIEIPFYLYSTRILQSCPAGQGIFIKQNQQGDRIDSIRFIIPGKQHDVLYTMSSGQLSGILLAFSLAMNKVFEGGSLKSIFIDDPVQCMDDLNIISFVELLKTEFCESQILISTHERNFENYIQYKYKKSGRDSQLIHLNAK